MKSVKLPGLVGAALLALASGCTSRPDQLVLDPVGPSQPPTPAPANPTGSLIVYSGFDPFLRGISDLKRQRLSDYRIFSPDGKLIAKVKNSSDTLWDGPTEVPLPAGNYRVEALANGYGTVSVPVVIAVGRTTTLHLEAGAEWPRGARPTESASVRLPDGRVVGWQASGAGATPR
jgi:hypothetical protein